MEKCRPHVQQRQWNRQGKPTGATLAKQSSWEPTIFCLDLMPIKCETITYGLVWYYRSGENFNVGPVINPRGNGFTHEIFYSILNHLSLYKSTQNFTHLYYQCIAVKFHFFWSPKRAIYSKVILLGQWLSAFLTLWPFNIVPHIAVTLKYKLISLIPHNCNFANVVTCKINIWDVGYLTCYPFESVIWPQKGHAPHAENHCFRW